jgi:hypothetical protein
MLFTNPTEIQAYLPTSVYRSSTGLLTLLADTEERYLRPVLGDSLFEKVGEAYRELFEEYGGVTPDVLPDEAVTDTVRLIRLCQKPAIYFALANNTGVLSVSLNDGGGFNRMSTEGYDAADEKSIARFERDAFFNARDGIDRLLLFLEKDAKREEPLFRSMWEESDHFYLHADLLFTTATELQRYMDIKNSRATFIELLPSIRYAQMAYLSKEVGDTLLDALVRAQTDSAVIPQVEDKTAKEARRVWDNAVQYLRMALALFVEARRPESKQRNAENEATLSLFRGIEYITANYPFFLPYLTDSPFLDKVKALIEKDKQQQEKQARKAEACTERFHNGDPDNAIFVFGGMGLNRH